MNEDSIDLKEQKPKGVLQKYIDATNKVDNDDRKEQMKLAIEYEKTIISQMKRKEPKIEEVVSDEPKINSAKLAQEIKQEMNFER